MQDSKHTVTLLIYSFTLFLSAGLLFWVQPLVAKMILPYLGGAPAVWNTCMMFFQALLLIGYLYAHFSSKYIPTKIQVIVQLVILIIAIFVLPIAIYQGWRPNDHYPIPGLLILLTIMVGLPLIGLTATAPMLQRWFSKTQHPHADDPYFLYSASNLGSMLALLSFPFLFEPLFTLSQQSYIWSGGFIGLIIFTFICALLVWLTKRNNNQEKISMPLEESQKAINVQQKLRWVLLAFAPSSLLLGVTTYLTTDIATAPLFWVIPLALYLLSFIITFARNPIISHKLSLKAQIVLLFPFVFILGFQYLLNYLWVIFIIHLSLFFFTAMVCHGELVKSRPHHQYLTEFYLWIAFGGVLGGIFNAIIAPHLFNIIVEYPLVLAIALMLRPYVPRKGTHKRFSKIDVLLPLIVLIIFVTASFFLKPTAVNDARLLLGVIFACCVVAVFSFPERPIQLGLGIGVLLITAMYLMTPFQTQVMTIKRNFFGTIRVIKANNNQVHFIMHGTTIHGVQYVVPGKQKQVLSYYVPLQDVFKLEDHRHQKLNIAVAGLGAGTIACYARPQDEMTFYEIDPLMIKIANTPKYFTYLQKCPARGGVILGDARLKLENAQDHKYNIIILDAFSSDAIPIHLMTKQAMQLYLKKLAPDGIIAFNITNRYLDMRYVLSALAKHLNLVARIRANKKVDWKKFQFASVWVVMARNQQALGSIANSPEWQPLPYNPKIGVWTDNYSNILSAIQW